MAELEPAAGPAPAPGEAGALASEAIHEGAASPDLEQTVIDVLRDTYDPEIPVNIYDLGMIYHVGVQPGGVVEVRMTLTTPMCPVAGTLPGEVEARIRDIPGVTEARVVLVWDPPWDQEMMTEAARLQLGL